MTDKEIINGLGQCVGVDGYCRACPYYGKSDCNNVMLKDSFYLIDRQKEEIERLQKIIVGFMDEVGTWSNKYDVDISSILKLPLLAKEDWSIRNKIRAEAIKELQHKSESILIKLYKKYHHIANKPSVAWIKTLTNKENEMFYQGRAEAIWECISVNKDIVKEMVGEQNETE